jgi:hydroxymethylpyrimidine pyrophosphatase-like HAD family hydrolase
VPAELQEAIAELQRKGAKWVINTGRDLPGLMEAMGRSKLKVRPDYLALVERELYVHRQNSYVPLNDWNSRCEVRHRELFESISAHVQELKGWIDDRFDAALYADAYSPLCVIAQTIADMDAIHGYLERFFLSISEVSVVRNDVYLRFSHRDYNKGSILQQIAEEVGATPDTILAAGDHHNDLPMLTRDVAGMLVAPGNAIPVVKNAVRTQGGYVAGKACGFGVLEGLRFYQRGDY